MRFPILIYECPGCLQPASTETGDVARFNAKGYACVYVNCTRCKTVVEIPVFASVEPNIPLSACGEEPELCSLCGSRAKRNREIFVRHFSPRRPTLKAMATEYGVTSTTVSQVIQKRLSAIRSEGPTDSADWDAWSKLKAEELGVEDVQRFAEALWGEKVDP